MEYEPTLSAMLDHVAEAYADREALVGSDERLTYAELRERVDAFARGLLGMGIGAGDHVGVRVSTRTEWFVATYAIQRVGATMVGLNTWYQPDELRYALSQTDVSALVTMDSFAGNDYLDQLTTVAPGVAEDGESSELPHLQRVVTIDGHREWTTPWDDVLDVGESVSPERLDAAKAGVAPEDDAYILFSSGTTGRPKPIVLRQDGVTTNPRGVGARIGVDADDTFLLPLPLFFSFAACNESVTALSHGATLVLLEQFDPAEALAVIERESVTVLYGMANMARGMEAEADDLSASLASVRRAQLLAPTTLQERFETEYGIDRVVSGYGLTETCAICTLASHEASAAARHRTVGRPLPNVDVRIVDPDTDREVPPGEQGEVRLRARTLFREYYGKPEQTTAAFDNRGYFRTGDVGRLDPQGRLLFEGRYKDMIKTGGINVSPEEVENALETHDDVREATVVGLPDSEKDEIVAAAIRPIEGADLDRETVRSYLRERLSSYKVPDVIEVWEGDFPRTDTGKVRKDAVERELSK